MKTNRLLLPAMLLALACAAPSRADVTVGSADSGNCYPFSCFASDTGSTYQQVYAGSAFSGPTSFDTISFFRFQNGLMDSSSFSIDFYLTALSPNGLTGTAALNRGTLLGNFGTFSLSGAMPSVLSFAGSTINYDPLDGNLLMEVTITGLTEAHGYESFFDADYTGTTTSRYYAYSGSPTGTADLGALVTRFGTGPVPEPATWAMMIGGFALAGGALRRSRAVLRIA